MARFEVYDIFRQAPDTSVRLALEEMAKLDPLTFAMVYRRLRGRTLSFDVSKEIGDPAVADKDYFGDGLSEVDREVKGTLTRHRPFLIQPLCDQHPHKSYQKGRQTGVTENSITEVIQFLMAHNGTKWIYCVPADAEMLTRRGWMKYNEIAKDDEALVLDPVTHVSKWEPVISVASFPWKGTLSPVGPFHCTPDHRWPVESRRSLTGKTHGSRKVVTTENIKPHYHKIPRIAPHAHDGSGSVLSVRLAKILGWVVTDGHQFMTGTKPNLNTVMMVVTQSSKKYLLELEELLNNKRRSTKYTDAPTILMGAHGGRIVGCTSGGNAIYGDVFNISVRREDINALTAAGYHSKADLPGIVSRLSPEAAEAMLWVMYRAEGCASGRDLVSKFFSQLRGPVLDAFQMLCTLTGRAANITGDGTHSGAYIMEADMGNKYLKPAGWKTKGREYDGVVWCPHTASGTWLMRYEGNVIFTGNCFPRDKQLVDFSTTRLSEALNESPRMHRLFGIPNQVYTKRIGANSFLFMRSAWESNLGEGVDADGVTFDEKDRMQDQIEVAFEESLSASKWHLRRDVSTPSLPGRGVNATYEKSCQFEWQVKCVKCGLEQTIEYPDNLIQLVDVPHGTTELPKGAYGYRCRKEKCRGFLDRLHGRWIAKYPERSLIHGYWIPQTICPWISATEVMQKLIKYRFKQLWQNYVMGQTSVGENIMLSDEDFASIIANHEMIHARNADWDQITVGVDWGHLNWALVLGKNAHNGKKYVLNVSVFEDSPTDPFQAARDVANFIAPFEPDVIIPDAGYGKDRNSYLLKRFPKRVFSCLDENTKVATLDHQGWKYIKDMKVGDYTYAWDGTRCVPTKVTHVHDNGVKKTLKVTIKDGIGREKTIIATPDHEFPMRLGGKKRADALQPGDRLVPFGRWKMKRGKYRAVDVFAMQQRGRVVVYEHRLVKPNANIVHHKDHDGLNNTPDNLECCATAMEHRKVHPIHMPESWVASLIERNKRLAGSKSRARNFANHVVVRVEECDNRHVWDLTVEHDAHNFAVEDGVFVKNCWYNPSEEKSRTFNPVWSEGLNKVLVDRTMTLKNMCRSLRDKEIGLPRMDQKTAMLIKHIKALAPMKEENDKGEIVEVIGHTGPDHLAHALGYSLVGFEKLEAGSAFSVDFM